MKKIVAAFLLALSFPNLASDLATQITQINGTAKLVTHGYAKLNFLRQETSLKGSIIASGILSVHGTANIVMWSKVGGAYYFSKLPNLQNVKNVNNMRFQIPFNAADKTVDEVVIEVEMLSKGSISISGFGVGDG